MSVYVLLLISSTLFSFLYSKAKDKFARVVLITLCFMSLFLPAAFRGGIGTDYFSYLHLYKRISLGQKIPQELGIVFISKILLFFHLPGHALIVTYSFLSILFVFLAIPKKYFYLGIPVYVLVFYLDSYCLLRQALACSIILYAYRKYCEGKNKVCFFWCIIAILNHKVMIIPLMILLFLNIFSKRSLYIKTVPFIILFILINLYKKSIAKFFMTSVVQLTPYAGYASNKFANAEAMSSTGLGFLLQIVLLIMLVYLIEKGSVTRQEYRIAGIYLAYLLFVRCIGQVFYIFVRLVNSCTFIYVPLTIAASKSKRKYKKILLTVFYISVVMLYIKGILNTPIKEGEFGGKQIYPYTTIYEYEENPILRKKKLRYGL